MALRPRERSTRNRLTTSAANLSALGRKPDWSELEKYQATITHDEFVHLLEQVYGSHGYNPDLIKVEPEAARILMSDWNEELLRPAFREK